MINAQWHETHRLDRKATLDQRIAWHLEHARECGCRDMPETIRQAIVARGIALPERRK